MTPLHRDGSAGQAAAPQAAVPQLAIPDLALPDAPALLAALPVPAFVTGAGLSGPALAAVNPALLALTGFPAPDLVGRRLDVLKNPQAEGPGWSGVLASLAAGTGGEAELLCARKDGASFWALVRIVPLAASDGAPMLGQIVDVSRRVDLEGALRLSQQREALGLLTNSIAHEFNNFLQILIGYVDGLRRRIGDQPDPFVQRALTRSTEATERAAMLTRHLLTHARRIVPDLRPVDLDALVAAFAERERPTLPGGIVLTLRATSVLPPALCNPTQVDLALGHILANAAEALSGEGEIEIASFAVPPGDRALQRPSDGAVGLAIRDRGHGMSAELLARALAPFATSREAGRGIGLAVVHSLMKRQNATITLDSRPGEGTTVRLVFPAAPLAAAPAAAPGATSD